MRLPVRLICLLFAAASPALASEPRLHDFEVLLDGRPIGTHQFQVRPSGPGTYEMASRASFDLRLLGAVLYRYRHEAQERIRDGCLDFIEASTDDNGSRLAVRGATRDGRFRLDQPADEPAEADCVLGYAYWDPQLLLRRRELLNPQTGRLDSVQIQFVGEEALQTPSGTATARRYRLQSDRPDIHLWYSESGQWLQLETRVRGGRLLQYRLRG
jgi:hypothetical protein